MPPEPRLAATPAFYQRRKKRAPDLLGQILIDHGAIDAALLRKALRLQEERGGQLGRILVASGGCSEEALAGAILEQLQRRTELGGADASRAARESPALAGLRVAASPVATVSVLVVTDALAILLACGAAQGFELLRTGALRVDALPPLGAVVLVCLAALALLGSYAPAAPSPPDAIRNGSAVVTLTFACVAAVSSLHGGRHAWSLPLSVASWVAALLVLPLARAFVRRTFARRAWWGHPVVVLGAGKTGRLVVRALRANPACGLKPVVMLDDDPVKHGTLRASLQSETLEVHSVKQPASELVTPSMRALSRDLLSDSARHRAAERVSGPPSRPSSPPSRPSREVSSVHEVPARRARGRFAEVEGVPVVGELGLAPVLARGLGVHYAIVAMPGLGSESLTAVVERVGGLFSHLLVIPDLFGLASLGVPARDVDGILGLEVRQALLLPWPRIAKRAMDVVLTCLGGVFVLPIVLLLALLIRLDSRGSALYPQHRLGRDGRRFRALKFRTMHGDGEERLRAVLDADPRRAAEYAEFHKLSDDPRVTRVGRLLRKYSLDELPQLWNVLVGDMSLVGPRPYLEREIPQMARRERVILRALPGMTGLWQVGDRNATGFTERLATDVHYVRNWSPWLDVWVLARTFGVVLGGTGS
jgi:Undecaprenyl-phosphate galactose phosphotransferase WbaP